MNRMVMTIMKDDDEHVEAELLARKGPVVYYDDDYTDEHVELMIKALIVISGDDDNNE